jgi:hypothetical protein
MRASTRYLQNLEKDEAQSLGSHQSHPESEESSQMLNQMNHCWALDKLGILLDLQNNSDMKNARSW